MAQAQERLWVACQAYAPDLRPHSYALYRLSGDVDIGALESALDDVVERHESLRTVFRHTLGRPRAVVLPRSETRLKVVPAGDDGEKGARRVVAEEVGRRFDLVEAPPWKVVLVRVQPKVHVLAVVLHEIVCDGWSFDIFLNDLAASYAARRDDRAPQLPTPVIQMREIAQREMAWSNTAAADAQHAYWADALGDGPLTFELDPPRSAGQGLHHEKASLADGMNELATAERVTPFMAYLAAAYVALHRLSGDTDFVIMSPTANRRPQELASPIGALMRNLPLRVRLGGDPTFRDVLRRVRESVVGGLANAASAPLPQELVLQAGGPPGLWSHAVQFRVHGSGPKFGRGWALAGVEVDHYPQGAPGGSLSFEVDPGAGSVTVSADASIFDASVPVDLAARYREAVEEAVAEPDACAAREKSARGEAWRGFSLGRRLSALSDRLRAHPAVADAVVEWDPDTAGVTAWLRLSAAAPAPAALDAWVRGSSGGWMLPSRYLAAERAGVPGRRESDEAFVALTDPPEMVRTRAPYERELTRIWTDLLPGPPETDANFFAAGGTLALGVELIARARDAGITIRPYSLLIGPTLRELSQAAVEADRTARARRAGRNFVVRLPPKLRG